MCWRGYECGKMQEIGVKRGMALEDVGKICIIELVLIIRNYRDGE